ncbi:hypothetical protein [Aurantiacibacter aquimixticola]|nr:hypothetical protein [Aurantiacibacter aquimixticola]
MAEYEPDDSRKVTHSKKPDASGLVATGAREDEARKRAKGKRPDLEDNPDADLVERAIDGGTLTSGGRLSDDG